MRAMVVYESMFGNTEEVARAVGEGLAPYAEVSVVNVDDVRSEAARQAVDGVRSGTGLREWFGRLKRRSGDRPVATFDTRLGKPRRLTGSAAVRKIG